MPRRTDLQSILVIGAGPIIIGQACEFDYSGTQACKALKEQNYRVILINSNPATIMTDVSIADATYIEPITSEFVTKVIDKERPDALLPTVGGQTGLNCAMELYRSGVLADYRIELIGAQPEAIERAENRQIFNKLVEEAGLKVPHNLLISNNDDLETVSEKLPLPAIVRPSYTLGGSGGGIANSREELLKIVHQGLQQSPIAQVQVDQSLLGWKEFELEVIRDQKDNCIVICSIENVDPMGVHTGDSVTVAPALTLSDREYQSLRDAAFSIIRRVGVETGGANVQFAICPETGEQVVIEMNPRVSRSSALASKATGFPIARVAALLAVGLTLDEIPNACTGGQTPASFEPTIDYIVTKIPRFDFAKFPGNGEQLGSAMRSVGEAMAIGRSFNESLQKAYSSLEEDYDGLSASITYDDQRLADRLGCLLPHRLLFIAEALRRSWSVEKIHQLSSVDRWFIREIAELVKAEKELAQTGLPKAERTLRKLRSQGFSLERIAQLSDTHISEVKKAYQNLKPSFKRIDTCAAEFNARTAYMYSSWEEEPLYSQWANSCEAETTLRRKIVILGSGPNRIGQGIEFDYLCVQGVQALQEEGFEVIMINCNPETVSTDYSVADRLYFEPLTLEHVEAVLELEARQGELFGVIVQYGGQTPLKLAAGLEKAGYPLLGTSVAAIAAAENRELFAKFLERLDIHQPENRIATSMAAAKLATTSLGYPLLLRPSYVLGGQGMRIIHSDKELEDYLEQSLTVSEERPLLLDSYLEGGIEIDVDAVADGQQVLIGGILEHVEESGIHSGDSACIMPPFSLPSWTLEHLERDTRNIALNLGVRGLLNIQFVYHGGRLHVLEVNPRGSRTTPFSAKASGLPLARLAALVMSGTLLKDLQEQFGFSLTQGFQATPYYAAKEASLPFVRFLDSDAKLGPEMRSTGEVMGLDQSPALAYARAFQAVHGGWPETTAILLLAKPRHAQELLPLAIGLQHLGFQLLSLEPLQKQLSLLGCRIEQVSKTKALAELKQKHIALVLTSLRSDQQPESETKLRKAMIASATPYSKSFAAARLLLQALQQWSYKQTLVVNSLQQWHHLAANSSKNQAL